MSAEQNHPGNYAPVNGLKLYYEIHGTGEPLVLLHGAYMNTNAMEPLLSDLAKTRQVIALDFQVHGRTADIDRPLRMELLADDVAALVHFLNLPQADIFGYSLGAGVAVQVAIRHPQLVRKLIAASISYNSTGIYPELMAIKDTITPEMFEGSPPKTEYDRIAPNPADFPTLVQKIKDLDLDTYDWTAEGIKGIKAPTFLILGDSDMIKPEHSIEMFRLLGGGVVGDLVGLPNSRLAILPGTTHSTVIDRVDWIVPMIEEFLNLPVPEQA